MSTDHETREIVTEVRQLSELVGHAAWPIVHEKFVKKVLDLQNAFNIDDKDPQAAFNDLQARKIASTLLFDFLRDIEGSVAVAKENEAIVKPSFVVRIPE